jgi:hypothetical protein
MKTVAKRMNKVAHPVVDGSITLELELADKEN